MFQLLVFRLLFMTNIRYAFVFCIPFLIRNSSFFISLYFYFDIRHSAFDIHLFL
jgi:hypothetical protein